MKQSLLAILLSNKQSDSEFQSWNMTHKVETQEDRKVHIRTDICGKFHSCLIIDHDNVDVSIQIYSLTENDTYTIENMLKDDFDLTETKLLSRVDGYLYFVLSSLFHNCAHPKIKEALEALPLGFYGSSELLLRYLAKTKI